MKTTLRRKALAGSTAVLAAFALFGSGVAPASASDAHPLYLNFETADNLGATAAAQAFEGAAATIGDSTNLSGKALKFTKSGQPWSGINLLLSPITAYHYADATLHTITMDYWSNDSAPSPVMMALETSVPSWQGGPKVVKTVEAQPGLNHLSFDMSTGTGWDDTKEWVTIALFPNFGADDTGYTGATPIANSDQVYEIDNISINGGTVLNVGGADTPTVAATAKVLTFEAGDADGNAAVGTCDGSKWACAFEGAVTAIVDAPAKGNGGKGLEITKGGQPWAGVNLYNGTDGYIKIAGAVTLNFFSPDTVKTPVQLQLVATDNSTANAAVEVSPGWNHLSIDMSAANGYSGSKTYQKVVIFPDFVNGGDVPSYSGAPAIAAGGQKYVIDDVAFNGGVTPSLPAPAVKPSNRVAASVVGTTKVGKTLTAGRGSWSGTATITYTYKWYRCTVSASRATAAAPTSAAKCVYISGGTAATHKVVTADVGKYLRVLVTARNSAGSTLSLSKTAVKATR
jgi:hypothetical protein